MTTPYFVHPTAVVDQPCEIGEGTKIWHFSHLLSEPAPLRESSSCLRQRSLEATIAKAVEPRPEWAAS